MDLGRVQERVAIVYELAPTVRGNVIWRTVILEASNPLDPVGWNALLGAQWLRFDL
jgi:hypothetical protein